MAHPHSTRRPAVMAGLATVLAGAAGLVVANFASSPSSHSATPAGAPALATGPKQVAPPAGVRVAVGASLQAAVNANPAGTTFVLGAGVHRDDLDIRPKNGDRFFGEFGAVMNGSKVLTGFAASGNHWAVGGQATSVNKSGQCWKTSPYCMYSDDVFYDGATMTRVASAAAVTAGTYFYDYAAGTIHVGSNPAGHTVELAIAGKKAFTADIGVGGQSIEIANLVIEKYGIGAQLCAMDSLDAGGGYRNTGDPTNGSSGGWYVHDVEARQNHGCGIYAGPGTRVLNSSFHDNGQLGMKAWGRNIEIRGNDVGHNNAAGFDTSWEAGGIKLWNSVKVTVAQNNLHDNLGSGVWSDYGQTDIVYDHNTITNNRNAGISHEMTISGKATGNYIAGNDWTNIGNTGYTSGGIFIYSSANFEVTGNVLDNNNGGVIVLAQERGCVGPNPHVAVGDCPAGSFHATVAGDWIHDNDITMNRGFTGLEILATSDYAPYAQQPVAWAASQFDGKTVRFDNNRYYGTGYESTHRGANGNQFNDGANNRFMWGWPSGWSSDPNNIWSWADRRYSGFDDFRLHSGQEAHASLNGSTPPAPPPTSPPIVGGGTGGTTGPTVPPTLPAASSIPKASVPRTVWSRTEFHSWLHRLRLRTHSKG